MFYDIELVDKSDNVENFKFNKISKKNLDKLIDSFKNEDNSFLEFSSEEGTILLERVGFRGIMYYPHNTYKTIQQENMDDAIEVSKVTLKKKQLYEGDNND